MRKILILAFLFCLSPSVVNAQPFQYLLPTLCDRVETVLDSIINKYGETPQWSGKDIQDGSVMVLFENLKDKTWTLIKVNKTHACILGVGTASKPEFGLPV